MGILIGVGVALALFVLVILVYAAVEAAQTAMEPFWAAWRQWREDHPVTIMLAVVVLIGGVCGWFVTAVR